MHIRAAMRQCKKKLQNRALLKDIADLDPDFDNGTKQNGINRILKRFVWIRINLALSEEYRSGIDRN